MTRNRAVVLVIRVLLVLVVLGLYLFVLTRGRWP